MTQTLSFATSEPSQPIAAALNHLPSELGGGHHEMPGDSECHHNVTAAFSPPDDQGGDSIPCWLVS